MGLVRACSELVLRCGGTATEVEFLLKCSRREHKWSCCSCVEVESREWNCYSEEEV